MSRAEVGSAIVGALLRRTPVYFALAIYLAFGVWAADFISGWPFLVVLWLPLPLGLVCCRTYGISSTRTGPERCA